MKVIKLLAIAALFSTSSIHAATITTKVTSKIEWTEEGAHFSSSKGNISIYTVGISTKQFQSLDAIKKGDCVLITAGENKLEKYQGTTSIMDFKSIKKVACK
jgi:hypothetical protein